MRCNDKRDSLLPHEEGNHWTNWSSNRSNPLLKALVAGKRRRNATPPLSKKSQQQKQDEQDAQPPTDQQRDYKHNILHRKQEEHEGLGNHLQPQTRRSMCKTCMRPQRVCICRAVAAVGGSISLTAAFSGVLEAVVVYVHPLETKRKLRSVTLLQQLVNDVHVFCGRKPKHVEQLLPLQHPHNLLLLFPTVHSTPLPVVPCAHSCPVMTALPPVAAAASATDASLVGPVAVTGSSEPTENSQGSSFHIAVRTAEEYTTSGASCGAAAVACADGGSHLAAVTTDPVSFSSPSASVACVDAASTTRARRCAVRPSECDAAACDDDFSSACNNPPTAQPAVAPASATFLCGSGDGGCVGSAPLAACFPLQLPLTLICLDGTWKECKEMFRSVEWLQRLPAVHLAFPDGSSSAEQQQQQQAQPGQQVQHMRQQPKTQQQDFEEHKEKLECRIRDEYTRDSERPLHQSQSEHVRKWPTQQQQCLGQQDTQHFNTDERETANVREEQKHSSYFPVKQQKEEIDECKVLQKQQHTQQQHLDDHQTQCLSDEQRKPQMQHQQNESAHRLQQSLQNHGIHQESCHYVEQCGPLHQQQKGCMGMFSSVRTPPPAIAGAGGVCTAEAICYAMAAIARYSRCSSIRALHCDDAMCQLLKYVAQQQHDCRQEAQRHGSSSSSST